MDSTLTPFEAAKYIHDVHGIDISSSNMAALARSGRGPRFRPTAYVPRYDTAAIDRWVSYFFADTDGPQPEKHCKIDPAAPTWLLVCENPYDGDILQRQFQTFGCNTVGPCYRAVDALTFSAQSFSCASAAFVEMDWNTEAAVQWQTI